MAEEQGGPRKETWLWLKLFSGFKIAILPSKLLLAAAGILVMALGWWLLAAIFFGLSSTAPDPVAYLTGVKEEEKEAAFKRDFKKARNSWNLLLKLAGTEAKPLDAGDLADSLDEYRRLDILVRFPKPIKVQIKDKNLFLIADKEYPITVEKEDLPKVRDGQTVDLKVVDKGKLKIQFGDVTATLNKTQDLEILEEYQKNWKIAEETIRDPAKKGIVAKALAVQQGTKKKPAGMLRTLPWFEYRGENPYLLVAEEIKGKEGKAEGGFITRVVRFFNEQIPVLFEPLVKFFSPVTHFFDSRATFGVRFYLLLVILWTLATWAVFGGAITRIAVVQAARPNEKVGMFEALRFARSRIQSFFSAPLIPLFFLAFLTLIMIILGFIEGFTHFLGDILAVFLWPLFFVFGLIMAVVLVGLIGWPLMYATISAEGSDSFDALSRSYSYVFQAIWRYLWYSVVALAYGAVLVFFVGLMGSLMVYMGKWAVGHTPFLRAIDREPTYYFVYAPTSFGWRDLFLHDSPHAKTKEITRPNGLPGKEYVPDEKYQLNWNNHIGAFLVSIWLYLIFLLVIGFGYSYFWTAASIIYLLMRKHVDDTELDEIHMEEDEGEPFPESPVAMGPGQGTPAAAAAPGFTMVDSPGLRTPGPEPGPPAPGSEPPPAGPPENQPPPANP